MHNDTMFSKSFSRKRNRRLQKLLQVGLVTIVLIVCSYSTLKALQVEKQSLPGQSINVIRLSTRQLTKPQHGEVVLLGKPKTDKVFLTIGIPTVCRVNGRSYLLNTLASIVNSTSRTEMHEIKMVVAVSAMNYSCVKYVEYVISKHYSELLNSGALEVIQVPLWYYPPLRNLRRTFNDEEFRVLWRSKQNVDFSFLMAYSQNKSKYYLQIEDDVFTQPNFLQTIKDYIMETAGYWAVLEFSSLGFIGKLFKSNDLQKMSELLLTFYAEQPCDYLLLHFINLMVQKDRFLRIPTIFQHQGFHSSLLNIARNVSDKFFNMGVRKYKGDNPPAEIHTSLTTFKDNNIERAYNKDLRGFFWSKQPHVGDTITLTFQRPQCIKRLVIDSGFQSENTDTIQAAIVEIGEKVIRTDDKKILCLGLRYLGEVEKGKFDKVIINRKTCEFADHFSSCVKITFTKTQIQWLLIKEIAIFTLVK